MRSNEGKYGYNFQVQIQWVMVVLKHNTQGDSRFQGKIKEFSFGHVGETKGP